MQSDPCVSVYRRNLGVADGPPRRVDYVANQGGVVGHLGMHARSDKNESSKRHEHPAKGGQTSSVLHRSSLCGYSSILVSKPRGPVAEISLFTTKGKNADSGLNGAAAKLDLDHD